MSVKGDHWYATFVLQGVGPPEVTTARLGIEPSRSYRVDEGVIHQQQDDQWAETSWFTWTLDSQEPAFEDGTQTEDNGVVPLQRHIDSLLDQLRPSWEQLVDLVHKGCEATIEAKLPLEGDYTPVDEDEEMDAPRLEQASRREGSSFDLTWETMGKLAEIEADLFVEYVSPTGGARG